MEKKIVWAAVFLFFGVSAGIAQDCDSEPLNPLPLDMAPNSVDDMYDGCKDKMEEKVRAEFLPNELNQDETFKQVWEIAADRCKVKLIALSKEQYIAICAFTLKNPRIYPEFNDAVRTQRPQYSNTFRYHSLHFFLTTALQTLKSPKENLKRKCLTGFRRTNKYFSADALNKEIRFGSFTSSSLGSYLRNDEFGDKTCFKIYTCFGVDISKFSTFGVSEREVLIPPYEIFKVTNIEKIKSEQNKNVPCKFEFKLISTERTMSKLNCGLFPT